MSFTGAGSDRAREILPLNFECALDIVSRLDAFGLMWMCHLHWIIDNQ